MIRGPELHRVCSSLMDPKHDRSLIHELIADLSSSFGLVEIDPQGDANFNKHVPACGDLNELAEVTRVRNLDRRVRSLS